MNFNWIWAFEITSRMDENISELTTIKKLGVLLLEPISNATAGADIKRIAQVKMHFAINQKTSTICFILSVDQTI